MSIQKRDFNKEAAAWDENPVRVKLALEIAQAMREEARPNAATMALDFGCGTGLVTLALQPYVGAITGVDSSEGMLGVLRAKVERAKLPNVTTRLVDVEAGGRLEGRYDLIVSSMTLHHIRNVAALLAQFHAVAAPSAVLCIADLDEEGGRFHGDNRGVFHFGFDRARLRRDFEVAGFVDVRDRTAARVTRPGADGAVREFTVMLMTGRREG